MQSGSCIQNVDGPRHLNPLSRTAAMHPTFIFDNAASTGGAAYAAGLVYVQNSYSMRCVGLALGKCHIFMEFIGGLSIAKSVSLALVLRKNLGKGNKKSILKLPQIKVEVEVKSGMDPYTLQEMRDAISPSFMDRRR